MFGGKNKKNRCTPAYPVLLYERGVQGGIHLIHGYVFLMTIELVCAIQSYPEEIWSRGYKTFFKLSSAEHEISTAHKC